MAGLTREQKAAKAARESAITVSGMTAEDFDLLPAEEQAERIKKAQESLEAEALAKAAADKNPAEELVDNSHLITVTKDGETLEVNPACLADHKRIGWKEV